MYTERPKYDNLHKVLHYTLQYTSLSTYSATSPHVTYLEEVTLKYNKLCCCQALQVTAGRKQTTGCKYSA